jgi:hypothetical protein
VASSREQRESLPAVLHHETIAEELDGGHDETVQSTMIINPGHASTTIRIAVVGMFFTETNANTNSNRTTLKK